MLERTDGDLIDLINERQSMTLVEKTEFVNSIHIGNFDNLSIINHHPSIIVIIQLIHPSIHPSILSKTYRRMRCFLHIQL